MLRDYVNYKATAMDTSKKMVDFLSTAVKESLYSSELSLNTEISEMLNLPMMNVISNEWFQNMAARYLRPKTHEYRLLIFKSITEVKPRVHD